MISYEDNRGKTFEELRERQEENGYSDKLLTELENENLNYLYEISMADRNNKAYMEPLLFAVKKDGSNAYTYEVFQYYGAELQKQELTTMAAEIAVEQPDVLKGTEIVKDPASVIYLAKINSEVIMYMSDDLKRDGEFIEKLCETGDKDIIRYAARECNLSEVLQNNPELANNPIFMGAAIKEDASLLAFASEELKNNYEFIKNVSKENYKVVSYIINNKEEFGIEAIEGAKETTRELIVGDYITIIDDMAKTSDDKRYKKVSNFIHEKGVDSPTTVKVLTAMVAQNSENVNVEEFQEVFDNAILTMTKIERDLNYKGKIKLSLENANELIRPGILKALREAAIEKGLEITQEQEKLFKEYEKFQKEYNLKWTEKKKQEAFRTVLNRAVQYMEEEQKGLGEKGTIKHAPSLQGLKRLKETAIERGEEITPEQEEMLQRYEEFYKKHQEKLVENKENDKTKVISQEKEPKGYLIEPKSIESVTVENSKLSEINRKATIMGDLVREEAEKTNENMEVTNDGKGSNGERQ